MINGAAIIGELRSCVEIKVILIVANRVGEIRGAAHARAMMHVTLQKFGNKVCIAYELRVPVSSHQRTCWQSQESSAYSL